MSTSKRRVVYVVCASDSAWPGVLGVHTSRARAARHHGSIVEDRKRWYRERWTRTEPDTAYTREHDPLMTVAETTMDIADRLSGQEPSSVTVKTLRVWA